MVPSSRPQDHCGRRSWISVRQIRATAFCSSVTSLLSIRCKRTGPLTTGFSSSSSPRYRTAVGASVYSDSSGGSNRRGFMAKYARRMATSPFSKSWSGFSRRRSLEVSAWVALPEVAVIVLSFVPGVDDRRPRGGEPATL